MTQGNGTFRGTLHLPVRDVDRAPPLVYGPVQSLRFGRSLGINLLPEGLRLCNFDCLYCQCGGKRSARRERDDPPFPTLEALERDLCRALARDPLIDDLCFAGAGEPTMHPSFREAVLLARALRNELAPRATVTVLSNGTTAGKPDVRAALALADRAVLKLDAVVDDTLRRLDRPPSGLCRPPAGQDVRRDDWPRDADHAGPGTVDNATPESAGRPGRCPALHLPATRAPRHDLPPPGRRRRGPSIDAPRARRVGVRRRARAAARARRRRSRLLKGDDDARPTASWKHTVNVPVNGSPKRE